VLEYEEPEYLILEVIVSCVNLYYRYTMQHRLTPDDSKQHEPHLMQVSACSGKFELLLTEQAMAASSINIQAWGHTSSHSSSSSEKLLGELQLSSVADITTALTSRHAVLYRIAATHNSSSNLHSSTIDDTTTAAQYSPTVGTVALRLQLLEPTSDTDVWTQRSGPVSCISSEIAATGTSAVRVCCLDATNLPLETEQPELQDRTAATADAASSATTVAISSSTSSNSSASSGSAHVGAVRCRVFLNNKHIGDSPWPLLQPSQQQLHTGNSVEAAQLSHSCPVWHADGSGCDLALQQSQQIVLETAAVTSASGGCITLSLRQHGNSGTDEKLCVELYQRTAAGTDIWAAGATLSTSHLLSHCAAASSNSKLRHDVLLATAVQHTASCIPPSLGLYIQSAAVCGTSSVQSLAVVHKEGTVPRRWLRVRLRGHSETDVTADSKVQCCLLVNRRLFGSCTSVHSGNTQQQWHGQFDVLLPTTGFNNPEIRVAMFGLHGFDGYAAVEYDTTANSEKMPTKLGDAVVTARHLQVVGVADRVLARLACTTEVSYCAVLLRVYTRMANNVVSSGLTKQCTAMHWHVILVGHIAHTVVAYMICMSAVNSQVALFTTAC
jgi:hypothetical protein